LIIFERIDSIRFKFDTEMEDGLRLRMEYKTTPKWAWPGSSDPISKCWDNFWTKRAIHFNFGTDIEDGASLRMDHKTTPKLAWSGSRDLIF